MQLSTTFSTTLIISALILAGYLIYQLIQAKRMRAQLQAAEARCAEITALEQQLQQLRIERDEAADRCVTLEQEHLSQQLVIEENYEQLQASYEALVAERDSLKVARKKPSKRPSKGKAAVQRDYAGEIASYLQSHPKSSQASVATALKMSRTTVRKYWPQTFDKLSRATESESAPQLSTNEIKPSLQLIPTPAG